MSRFVLIALLALVSLPAAAAAKGPHASLSVPPETPQPGEPWTAKLRVFDFGRDKTPPPVVAARRGADRVLFSVQPLQAYVPRHPDVLRESPYRLRGVFPSAGRWRLTVTGSAPGAEPFRFEPLQVGGGVASPVRHYLALPGEAAARSRPLPPDVMPPPAAQSSNEDKPARVWIPAVGIALAGAGAFTVLRRRRRMAAG